jgi:hypothetical protein
MKRLTIAFFVLLGLSPSVSCPQQTGRESPVGSFQKFWSDFREAALTGNKDKIASLAEFPFQTRGILDSDPLQMHDRASFLSLFDRLLSQDPGLSREPQTMRSLLERTRSVTGKALDSGGDTARIGAFVFQRIGGRWRFTRAYIED